MLGYSKKRETKTRSFRIEVILFVALLAMMVFVSIAGATSDELHAAPLNPDFVRFITEKPVNLQTRDSAQPLGLIPSPISRPEIKDIQMFGPDAGDRYSATSTYPATFDLRTTGNVTPVKNQGNFGTCWAFATYGSLESTSMPVTPTQDFSEKNLANLAGFNFDIPNGGGHMWMSAAYLTRWNGPVAEVTDPYPTGAWTSSGTYPPVKHVQNVVFFPARSDRTDNGNIKGALTQWGAVYSSFFWDNSFYNAAHTSYYQPSSASNTVSGGGHAVTIIGWDDTYAATNFNTAPPLPGAWIVKNSWGTGWGNNGYFYVSYCDKYFGSALQSGFYRDTAVFKGESTSQYNTLYSYDTLGEVSNYYYTAPKTATFANVFTATSPGNLTAIGFYTTDLNVPCNFSIYKNPASGPVGGTPVATFSQTLPTMGYNTVKIPDAQQVAVTTGDKFSVVIQVTNPNYAYCIPVEMNLAGYTSGITSFSGQSYVLGGSEWMDWKTIEDNSHICVKAYASSAAGNNATLRGKVFDSVTALSVSGATVSIAGLSTISDSNGNYVITGIPPGVLDADFTGSPRSGNAPLTVAFSDLSVNNAHTLTGAKTGYYNFTNSGITIEPNQDLRYDIPLTPILNPSGGEFRIVLTWGENPSDLDSHLQTPVIEGQTYHVYYSNKGSMTSPPYAQLDLDDVTSYGPETITINRTFTGTYNYYVYHYAGSGYISTSGAEVKVYNKTTLIATYRTPTTGTGRYWQVFNVDGITGAITSINSIADGPQSSSASESPIEPVKYPEKNAGTTNLQFMCPPESDSTLEHVPFMSSTVDPILTWIWNFGDGTSNATAQNPSHTYTHAGIYTVTLTVANTNRTSTETKVNYITVTSPPVANFTATPTSGIAPLNVQFTDASANFPTGWNWSFGDGALSSAQNPAHAYANAGTYTVALNVTNAGGSNITVRQNYITVTHPEPVKPHVLYATNASGAQGQDTVVSIYLNNSFNPKAGAITYSVSYNETLLQARSVTVASGGVAANNLSSPFTVAYASASGYPNGNSWLANITFQPKVTDNLVTPIGLTLEELSDVVIPPHNLLPNTSVQNGYFTIGGGVQVNVIDGSGNPMTADRIALESGTGTLSVTGVSSYRFNAVPTGTYQVNVTKSGYIGVNTTISYTAGSMRVLTATMVTHAHQPTVILAESGVALSGMTRTPPEQLNAKRNETDLYNMTFYGGGVISVALEYPMRYQLNRPQLTSALPVGTEMRNGTFLWTTPGYTTTNATLIVTAVPVTGQTVVGLKFTGGKLGDVYYDNKVTSTDSLYDLHYVVTNLRSLSTYDYADVTRDGKITSTDALYILHYVVGNVNEYYQAV